MKINLKYHILVLLFVVFLGFNSESVKASDENDLRFGSYPWEQVENVNSDKRALLSGGFLELEYPLPHPPGYDPDIGDQYPDGDATYTNPPYAWQTVTGAQSHGDDMFIVDLDNDGTVELITMTDSTQTDNNFLQVWRYDPSEPYADRLVLLDQLASGHKLQYSSGEYLQANDFDGDGTKELIHIGNSTVVGEGKNMSLFIYNWDGTDLSLLTETTWDIGLANDDYPIGGVRVADFDSDNENEVLTIGTTWVDETYLHEIKIWECSPDFTLFSNNSWKINYNEYKNTTGLEIYDLDNDGFEEIYVASTHWIGTFPDSTSYYDFYRYDFDGDSLVESSYYSEEVGLPLHIGGMYHAVVNLNGDTPEWVFFVYEYQTIVPEYTRQFFLIRKPLGDIHESTYWAMGNKSVNNSSEMFMYNVYGDSTKELIITGDRYIGTASPTNGSYDGQLWIYQDNVDSFTLLNEDKWTWLNRRGSFGHDFKIFNIDQDLNKELVEFTCGVDGANYQHIRVYQLPYNGLVQAIKRGTPLQENGEVSPGEIIQYTITILNNGNADLVGVEFFDPKPEQFETFEVISIPEGSEDHSTSNLVHITGIDIPEGEEVEIVIRGRLKSEIADSEVVNQGRVVYDSDNDGENDTEELTDDPDTSEDNDPTILTLNLPQTGANILSLTIFILFSSLFIMLFKNGFTRNQK
ncbi:MAG: hypothetical protein ABIE03_04625 [Patescibacteria group bacterium]|nr:hypothetical protein [Patescibacteria group bacterium]